MSEWRGVVIQLAFIASLTAIVMKATDPLILHSGVGIIGASLGSAVMRSRTDVNAASGGKGSGKGSGFSVPPIIGAITCGVLSVFLFALLTGCGAATPSAADQARVASYEAELLACVASAVKRDAGVDDSAACRASVSKKYGRLDAGTE
jgi:uncharacterized membrane protein